MKSLGLSVPRTRGEEVRRDLAEAGLLRTELGILHEGETLVLPVRGRPAEIPTTWGQIVEREFLEHRSSGPTRFRDLLPWTEAEKEELPRSFDVVGDIVLIRIPPSLSSRRNEIGDALLRFVPGARLVGADHGVHGPERRRSVERIAGTGPWRTRHKENGVELEVDVEKAYFSPRLAREHARVAEEIRAGDRVYDLCCGVGPFTVTIARAGKARAVTAIDANSEAIGLLRDTLSRLTLTDRVSAIATRLEEFLPSATPVERVVLNLPREGIKYLPSVARAVSPGGRLYYYEVVPRSELERRGSALVTVLASEGSFSAISQRAVHPYSPDADLAGFVLERSE
jgi:tRNA (guanine37-N1)-methyltransferase